MDAAEAAALLVQPASETMEASNSKPAATKKQQHLIQPAKQPSSRCQQHGHSSK
jgi:hypothetical protein